MKSIWLWCSWFGLCHVHFLVGLCVPNVFASMRSFELANSRSLSPLSFVLTLQLVLQVPLHTVLASSPTFAFQSPCTMSMSFFSTRSMTFCSWVIEFFYFFISVVCGRCIHLYYGDIEWSCLHPDGDDPCSKLLGIP